jgi:hypothetical protein
VQGPGHPASAWARDTFIEQARVRRKMIVVSFAK